MATFSVNQVRHLYVATATGTSPIVAGTAKGSIDVKNNSEELYFVHQGAGGITRSDLIKKANILGARATSYTALRRGLGKRKVVLNDTLVTGQDYVLGINIKQWGSDGEESSYYKNIAVRATSTMTTQSFYQAIKAALELSFKRESVEMFTFELVGVKAAKAMSTNTGITVTAKNIGTEGNAITFAISSVSAGSSAITVTGNAISVALKSTDATIGALATLIAADATASKMIVISGTAATAVVAEAVAVTLTGGATTGVVITEVEQPWLLGRKASEAILFDVIVGEITTAAKDEVTWGTVTVESPTVYVGNGKNMADLEYFCMGARGDLNRGMDFPLSLPVEYLVDATKQYNVLDIDFYYVGAGENPQKSQRTITILVPAGTTGSVFTLFNTILNAVESASGLTIHADFTE